MKPARQEILEKLNAIRHKQPQKPDFTTPIYPPLVQPAELAFQKNLEQIGGKVDVHTSTDELFAALKTFVGQFNPETVFCNHHEIGRQLSHYKIPYSTFTGEADQIEVGITACEFLIAQTGSIMLSSAENGGRQMIVYPPVHVVVAQKKQMVDDLASAYTAIQHKYPEQLPSQITLVSGPSRTADIEKTLIMGAHGPKELHVFLA